MDEALPQSKSVEFYELSGILFPGVLVLLAVSILLWTHGGAPLPGEGTEGKFGFVVGFGTVFLVVAYLCGHATVAGAVVTVDAMLFRRVIGRPQFWLLDREIARTRAKRADNRLAGAACFLVLLAMLSYVGAAYFDARWSEPSTTGKLFDQARQQVRALDAYYESVFITFMRWFAYLAIVLLSLRGFYRQRLNHLDKQQAPGKNTDPRGDEYPELLSLDDEERRANMPFSHASLKLDGSQAPATFRTKCLDKLRQLSHVLCIGIEYLGKLLGFFMLPAWILLKFLSYTRPLASSIVNRALARLDAMHGTTREQASDTNGHGEDEQAAMRGRVLFHALDDGLMPLLLMSIERRNSLAIERLRRLYNLYRIARNGFFAALIATILVSKAARAETNASISMAVASFAVLLAMLSLGLLLRALHLNGAVYCREAIQYFALGGRSTEKA